jgi:tRNA dimethylallyltransferase
MRSALAAEAEANGIETLHRRLEAVDPDAARAIGPTNLRRIIRALEVYQVTGRPISEQQTKSPPPYAMVTLWLDMPREHLYRRIDERVDRMIEAGLVDEVRTLLQHGYGWDLPAMSSLGYKEFRPYFAQQMSLDECIQTLKWNTHAFARRQIAWFKRLPEVRVVTAGHGVLDSALREIDRRG